MLAFCLTGGAVRGDAIAPFTVIVLPDTQKYAQKYPRGILNQMEWIVQNRDRLNLKFVVHEGDVVETAGEEREWQLADQAFRILEGSVPYSLCVGNHDMDVGKRDKSLFSKYFPLERFQGQAGFGGAEEPYSGNTYHFFDVGHLQFMVVNLEFKPTDETLKWAGEVVAKHPERRVIVNTHSFLNVNERNEEGKAIWDTFVQHHPNIFLVLCGHLSVGRRVDRGLHGNVVHQVLANYQDHDNGGLGWLRILRFVPAANKIEVTTYSTLLNRYMTEGDPKWSELEDNFFQLPYLMEGETEAESKRFAFASVNEPAAPAKLYRRFELEGWPILLHPELEHGQPDLCADVLDELTRQLRAIVEVVPPRAVDDLRRIPIWIERDHPEHPCMCYHPDAGWLRENGMNPDKAGAVEIANAENFVAWTEQQPWMVLHELAHAYHFQTLGVNEPRVMACFETAVGGKHYEEVAHVNGSSRRHYALTNQMEYFAEATEAWFGMNDFYPFTRKELQTHDADMAALMPVLWGATDIEATLQDVTKIWDKGKHNAFTDLIRWKGRFYCVFREGEGHADSIGQIQILESVDGKAWRSGGMLTSGDYDLRDPKLSIMPDGKLLISGGAQQGKGEERKTGTFVSSTADGIAWSDPEVVIPPGRWLWSLTWHDGVGYGVSYPTPDGEPFSSLLATKDGREFETRVPELLGEGRPTEAVLRRGANGLWYCLHRRDGDPNAGLIGTAPKPEGPWVWKDLHERIGGPSLIQIPSGDWIAVVRRYRPDAHTEVCHVDPEEGRLTPLMRLPSGGDTSYPGLVWHEDELWISYYSSHEEKSVIYLARVRFGQKKPA